MVTDRDIRKRAYGRRCIVMFSIGAGHVRNASNQKFCGKIAYCHRIFPPQMGASDRFTWILLVHSPLVMVLSIASRSWTVFRVGLRRAIPLQDIEASTIFRAFFDNLVSRYGSPESLTADQGSQFESQLFSAFLQLIECNRI